MPISDKNMNAIILGCPRSGTTLLRRLIDAHSDICCPGETYLFRACAHVLQKDDVPNGLSLGVVDGLGALGFTEDDVLTRLRAFITGFYEDLTAQRAKKIWVAKTAADSFYIDAIEKLFVQDHKFIAITRHGLDVAASMNDLTQNLQTYIAELHPYIRQDPHPYQAFVRAWSDVTNDILDFAARHPERTLLLRYEDLVAAPDDHMAQLFDFLDVPPQDVSQTLSTKKSDGIGDWKAAQKQSVDKSSSGRWKDLPPALVHTLAPLANATLERAGYEPIKTESDEDQRRRELAMMMMGADSTSSL